jgi:hypothetical protein
MTLIPWALQVSIGGTGKGGESRPLSFLMVANELSSRLWDSAFLVVHGDEKPRIGEYLLDKLSNIVCNHDFRIEIKCHFSVSSDDHPVTVGDVEKGIAGRETLWFREDHCRNVEWMREPNNVVDVLTLVQKWTPAFDATVPNVRPKFFKIVIKRETAVCFRLSHFLGADSVVCERSMSAILESG